MSTVSTEVTVTLDEARKLTEDIRFAGRDVATRLDVLQGLVATAKSGNVHIVLGFASWTAYISDALGENPLVLEADARRALVAELSEQGMSTRAIAPIVGVDRKTVERDVRGTFVPPVHGEVASPRVVEGRDGKSYQIPAPKVSFKDISLKDSDLEDFCNIPLTQIDLGPIEATPYTSIGPSEIRSSIEYLTTSNTGLESAGRAIASIKMYFEAETPTSRAQITRAVVPPMVKLMRTMSNLIMDAGLEYGYHSALTDPERALMVTATSEIWANMGQAYELLKRPEDKELRWRA